KMSDEFSHVILIDDLP
ncbi:hypothetical protein EI555_007586, partial [Monodon monoceros]